MLGRAQPVRDSEGTITRWFGTCTDIQDIVDAREVLAKVAPCLKLDRRGDQRTEARSGRSRRAEDGAAARCRRLHAIGQLPAASRMISTTCCQVVSSGICLLRMPKLTNERRDLILDGITQAAKNAQNLTSQLLSFARQQSLNPETIDLNERLHTMSELLRHSLGSRIRIETDFAADLWPVTVDASQLETAVLNLAVNARDAMPQAAPSPSRLAINAWRGSSERGAGGISACLSPIPAKA